MTYEIKPHAKILDRVIHAPAVSPRRIRQVAGEVCAEYIAAGPKTTWPIDRIRSSAADAVAAYLSQKVLCVELQHLYAASARQGKSVSAAMTYAKRKEWWPFVVAQVCARLNIEMPTSHRQHNANQSDPASLGRKERSMS